MKKIAVLINFYKSNLTPNEIQSLKNCISVLKNYDLILLGPEKVDLTEYDKNVGYIKRHLVDHDKFKGNENYNKYLLSEEFYFDFKEYRNILIFQLDCFVFKDELKLWAKEDFDFIGAPLFENNEKNTNFKFIGVGNGGLSLRKPEKILSILQHWEKLISYKKIFTSKFCNRDQKLKLFKAKTVSLLTFSIVHTPLNKIFIKNEDSIIGLFLSKELGLLKTPTPEKALKFSMEIHPEYLYNINNKVLPFGCHAWEKYDNPFWLNFIPNKNTKEANAKI